MLPNFSKFLGSSIGDYDNNDHLGTPQMMTTSSGAVVWKAKYSSFGKAAVDSSSTVENPLRLPGQYEDAETGLHYNWFRYFNAELGRYLTVDPLGFEAEDENFYVYVWNNTNNWKDPSGLSSEWGQLPGTNIPYRIDWREAPTPDMHVYWKDGTETIVSHKGKWMQGLHRGKYLVKPPIKYRKPLRKVVKFFVKKAGKFVPGVNIFFWGYTFYELYQLTKDPCATKMDYLMTLM